MKINSLEVTNSSFNNKTNLTSNLNLTILDGS